MIYNKNIYHKVLCLSALFVIVAFLFTGCISSIYSTGCITIRYNGHNYNCLTDWEMNTDKYNLKTISQDSVNLKLRLYDNDVNNEFLFCEDNGSLYHNDDFSLPDNNVENIDYFTYLLHSSNDEIVVSENNAKEEFINILSGKSVSNVEYADNLLTIAISYKNYPAIYYYGNIVIDKEDNYWLLDSYLDDDSNVIEQYYPMADNSLLLSFLK